MRATRSRRIVRRAVMTLAIVLLLPAWYLLSVAVLWAGLEAGAEGGWLSGAITYSSVPEIYMKPALWYLGSELPGSDAYAHVIWWVQNIVDALNGDRR